MSYRRVNSMPAGNWVNCSRAYSGDAITICDKAYFVDDIANIAELQLLDSIVYDCRYYVNVEGLDTIELDKLVETSKTLINLHNLTSLKNRDKSKEIERIIKGV